MLDESQLEQVQDLADTIGIVAAAQQLGIGVPSLVRILEGEEVRRGTVSTVVLALQTADVEEEDSDEAEADEEDEEEVDEEDDDEEVDEDDEDDEESDEEEA